MLPFNGKQTIHKQVTQKRFFASVTLTPMTLIYELVRDILKIFA